MFFTKKGKFGYSYKRKYSGIFINFKKLPPDRYVWEDTGTKSFLNLKLEWYIYSLQ